MIQTENKLPCAYLGSKAEELIALKSANTNTQKRQQGRDKNCDDPAFATFQVLFSS